MQDVCPGCEYPLAGVTPDADGCSVCSECGAAWNLALWKRDFQEPDLDTLAIAAEALHAAKLFITDARGWGAPFLERRDRYTIIEEVRERSPLSRWRTGIPALVIVPVVVVVLLAIRLWGDGMIVVVAVVAGVLSLLTTIFMRAAIIRATRKGAATWARDFIALSVCPRCESSLREQPARDGTKICENCRHAWKNTEPRKSA